MFRASPVKRIGRERFLRNVAIALGNAGGGKSQTAIERLPEDPSPLGRGAAVWAFRRTQTEPVVAERRARLLTHETDLSVVAEWG